MTATDAPPTPAAPPKRFAVLFRKSRGRPWRELFSASEAEAVWRWSLEFRESGHFRYVERPADLTELPPAEGD